MNQIKRLTCTLIVAFLLSSMTLSAALEGHPVNLKSDYLENPIGIDNATPRLSWRMEDRTTGAHQTAYRIVVGSDSLAVLKNQGDMWDTRKRNSEDRLIPYAGKELVPFTRYFWKVILWDADQEEASSAVHFFETGMMQPNNWQGSWIGDGRDIHYKPASYFRKQFAANKEIVAARAYIAVAGLYELYINGDKVGDHHLDPM